MAFNLVILAKRGWGLLIHLDSLYAKVLKAKCHLHVSLFDASEGYQPSYVCCSLCGAILVLSTSLC